MEASTAAAESASPAPPDGPAPRLAPPGLDGRLSGGDTLVVVRIDRIGRRWLDTLQCSIALRARGVKIRSLDETEGWTQFLELEPDDPLAFVGHQMVSMAAWVADQEREVGRRCTREGAGGGKSPGPAPGRRRSLTDQQVRLARRMKDSGASGRKLAQLLEVNEKTVRDALKAEP